MRMKKLLAVITAVAILTSFSVPCYADDNPFVETFQSALYGGLAGALVGAALLVFTEHAEDHLDYIAYGGAGGVIVGTVYGVAKASKSLAEYENGKVKFAIPTVVPELRQNTATGSTSVVFNTQLVRGTF